MWPLVKFPFVDPKPLKTYHTIQLLYPQPIRENIWDWQISCCCFKINHTLIRTHHSQKVNFIYCNKPMYPLASFLYKISFQNYLLTISFTYNCSWNMEKECPLNPAWIRNKVTTRSQYCRHLCPKNVKSVRGLCLLKQECD